MRICACYNETIMNPVAFVYLLGAVSALLVLGGYFLSRALGKKKGKDVEKVTRLYRFVVGIIALVVFFITMFFVPIAMNTRSIYRQPQYDTSIGNVNLIGVPYGENKAANVFAWLGVALFLPSAAFALLCAIFPSKRIALVNRYIGMPILSVTLFTLFNLAHAYTGSTLEISYKTALLSASFGLTFGVGILGLFEDRGCHLSNKKEIGYLIAYFLLAAFAFLPMGTFAMFVPTDVIFLGKVEYAWRIYEFSFTHRLYIYIGIAYFVTSYFFIRSDDYEGRRAMLIALGLGALSSFFTEYGFEGIWDASNGYKLMVTRLPIHLCHTALFVVPLTIAFKWKKLFYFTYFINVFGAFAAMAWPNNGEYTNIFDPSVLLFWWNHMNALCMPLMTVSLKVFKRPKMKQMGYSLGAFAVYFVLIMIANGYLSNFVPGYKPGVLGSGTDYLFINNDYVLGIFGEEAKKMLNVRIQFNSGDLVLVYYPLYQSVFFVGYVLIAFLMWFVYSLFFIIEDSHIDLHYRYAIIRKSHLSFKEAKKMNQTHVGESSAKLEFLDFTKRYGNSDHLAADKVSFEVKEGQVFGFLGPNGAGKSTCIKSAIGIQPPSEGTIKVCGYDIVHEPIQAKKCIGYVPDHYALYENLTGREYVNYVADLYGVKSEERDARIEKYVKLLELSNAFDSRIETYSHGMKQKVAIIAALTHNPKVWILDEPLTGLDPQSIYQVKQAMLTHAKEGNIVFFSSHIIDVVEKLCTEIAIIKKGHIVFHGSMKEVEKEHLEGLEQFYMAKMGEEDGRED